MKISEVIEIIKQGEGENIEFKISITDLGKVVCAFANTSGGIVLVGVDDNGQITGVKGKKAKQKVFDSFAGIVPAPQVSTETIKIGTKTIIGIKVLPSSRLLSFKNIVYIRVGGNNRPLSISEILEKSAESLKIFFDEQSSKIEAKAADRNLIENYLSIREKTRGVRPLPGVWENAQKIKAVEKKNGKSFLTNAGVLFFTSDPTDFYSFAKARLIWFEDEEMQNYKDAKEFSGPLSKIVRDVEKYWVANLKTIGGFRIGFKRGEVFEYPLFSLREALINALIHRNYFDASEVTIFIFPDRIEIKNPGSFPPGVTPEKPEHKPRNPILSQYMYDLGLTEKYGGGIIKIKKECKEHPLVDVSFVTKPFTTRVIFKKVRPEVKLDDVSEKILQRLRAGDLSSGQLRQFISLSRQTLVSRLNNLEMLGFIERVGKGRGTKYRLKSVSYPSPK
ncbi:putative DNA binding domain-containing protein [Patescibacteria group bacterium]|nr:putative DNA binding domain-containing protein [Patescibacteria group bacterium]